METTIKIKPVNYSLDTLEIINVGVQLDKTAYVNCMVKGEKITNHHTIELTTDEYSAWGNDDNYIVDLLLSKLGLEKA
jgi:hypothetical protein